MSSEPNSRLEPGTGGAIISTDENEKNDSTDLSIRLDQPAINNSKSNNNSSINVKFSTINNETGKYSRILMLILIEQSPINNIKLPLLLPK